jgi:hypothetical protein
MGMGRSELFVVVATALLLVTTAWFVKTGVWRRGRMGFVAAAVLAGLLLATHRVGWGELLVLFAVLGVPLLLVLPRRPPPAGGRR